MPGSAGKTMGLVERLLLVMLSVFWGDSFFFSKVALAELRPFTIVLFRAGIAAAVLRVIVYASGLASIDWRSFSALDGAIMRKNSVPKGG